MLLLSLTSRYKAITREMQSAGLPERSINAQTRFVHFVSRSLTRPEVCVCLEQIRVQARHNRRARHNCLKSLIAWLVVAIAWGYFAPAHTWMGGIVPAFHVLGLFYLKRVQANLAAIERCLCLLKSL